MNLKYLLEGAVSINPILFALSLCETAGVRRGRLSNRMRIPPVSEKVSGGSKQMQLVNPLAPRRYGSGVQVLVADPQDPQERFYAVRLFSIAF
jgi:hypothetical protein